MNYRSSLVLAMLVAIAPAALHAASTPSGFVDFGKFSPAEDGGEFVEVNINSNLISMVARIAKQSEPDVAEMLQGLKAIRVNVIGLSDDNREDMTSRIKAIRTQLDGQGWERVVTAQQNKDDVGVYLKTRGEEAVEGVVVTVLDGKKQAVLVNVVGDIKPEKLGELGERFNIDPLKKLGAKAERKAKNAERKAEKKAEQAEEDTE